MGLQKRQASLQTPFPHIKEQGALNACGRQWAGPVGSRTSRERLVSDHLPGHIAIAGVVLPTFHCCTPSLSHVEKGPLQEYVFQSPPLGCTKEQSFPAFSRLQQLQRAPLMQDGGDS